MWKTIWGNVAMPKALYRVKEGDFVRHLEAGNIRKVIAQEAVYVPLKFVTVGINPDSQTAYVMRHGRTDKLRTWRLDNLASFLRKHEVKKFEVEFQYGSE